MDYEKKYKEALERARKSRLQLLSLGEEATEIEYIFPELKENEDEKTKNQLIDFVKSNLAGFPQCEKYIAWIDKQGEQNKEYLYDVIVVLWDLLDKIDTVSELYIDDTDSDNPFRKIMHTTQERHKFVKSDGYNLFIDNVKITNRKSPEKQSEQDTINRIEPKFKVGDWVTIKE